MVHIDIAKLRWIFDSVATDIEAVSTDAMRIEADATELRLELTTVKARYAQDMQEATRTIRKLKRELKRRLTGRKR